MKIKSSRQDQSGFAIVEAVLILVVIAAIAGVGYYVVNQNKQASKTLNSTASNSGANTQPAAPGTTASIDQLTSANASAETSADNSADSQIQSNLNSTNSASNSVGGAYNENNL